MLALTLRQPWAWAVVHGTKDIENRCWMPPMSLLLRYAEPTGGTPFAVHAAARPPTGYFERAAAFIRAVDPELGKRMPPIEKMPMSAIVGGAQLIGIVPPQVWGGGETGAPLRIFSDEHVYVRARSLNGATDAGAIVRAAQMSRWWMPHCFGYVLRDRWAIDRPITAPGKLKFWTTAVEVAQEQRNDAGIPVRLIHGHTGALDGFALRYQDKWRAVNPLPSLGIPAWGELTAESIVPTYEDALRLKFLICSDAAKSELDLDRLGNPEIQVVSVRGWVDAGTG